MSPAYSPYWSYPYGVYAPWMTCAPGFCPDALELRRVIRRELQRQENLRELEETQGGFSRPGESIRVIPRYLPPPTPDWQVQPGYRGSGDVRPEYGNAGRAKTSTP
jgi:hypothetical protein